MSRFNWVFAMLAGALPISPPAHADIPPQRYENRVSATDALLNAMKDGTNVDVGLMQISSRWHAGRVARIDQLLDPYINLEEGAGILHEQYLLSTDWWDAVGRYHSPGKSNDARQRAQNCRERVYKIYLSITGEKYVRH